MFAFLSKFLTKLSGDFSFHISFDGNLASRITRGFDPCILWKNIKALRRACAPCKIRLKFTITPHNYRDIIPAWEEANENQLDIKFKLGETAKNYTNTNNQGYLRSFTSKEKTSIAQDLMKIIMFTSSKNPDRLFLKKMVSWLRGNMKISFCAVPQKRIFVMPNGSVHSCLHHKAIGQLKMNSLEEIWHSPKADLIRKNIDYSGCNKCLAYHGRI